jgi:hypothetical protein
MHRINRRVRDLRRHIAWRQSAGLDAHIAEPCELSQADIDATLEAFAEQAQAEGLPRAVVVAELARARAEARKMRGETT